MSASALFANLRLRRAYAGTYVTDPERRVRNATIAVLDKLPLALKVLVGAFLDVQPTCKIGNFDFKSLIRIVYFKKKSGDI